MPPAAPATTSDQALGNVQSFTQNMQSPDAILSGAQSQLGIPQAQQQVSGLRQAIANTTNLLNNVAPGVMGRTENSLVTAAQANKQIQNESAPIANTLKNQTSNEANAESDLTRLQSEAGSQASLKEQGQNAQLSALDSIYKDLSAKEQAQATAQANAQAQAEKEAEFQATLNEKTANDQATQSTNAAKVNMPSTSDQKIIDMGNTSQYLNSLKGADGHVSQQTWNNAMQQWINAGYSAADFVKNNMQFINQRYTGYHGFS